MDEDISEEFPQLSPVISIGASLILAFLYVSSLYVWNSEQNRDDPDTVKNRFISVSIVMLISPAFVYWFSSKQFLENRSLLDAIGIRLNGLLPAIIVPYLLTALLYLGPLSVQIVNGTWKTYFDLYYWKSSFKDIFWIRNHIVAPLSEEFTFRSCMMPLLLQSFKPLTSVLITSLLFGIAHFHHMNERFKRGMDLKSILIISCYQFIFTTLFGFYSGYLFVKTHHLITPFLAHVICNYMGVPHIEELIEQTGIKRYILTALYIIGLSGWLFLTPQITKPEYFHNQLYWNS